MTNQDLQQYKPLYLQTAREYLNSLQNKLTILLKIPNDTVSIKQAHIDSHSLKSQSLMMQYNNIASFSGTVEEIFSEAEEKKLTIKPEIIQLIQQGTEKMIQSLKEIEQHDKDINMEEETEVLKKLSKSI